MSWVLTRNILWHILPYLDIDTYVSLVTINNHCYDLFRSYRFLSCIFSTWDITHLTEHDLRQGLNYLIHHRTTLMIEDQAQHNIFRSLRGNVALDIFGQCWIYIAQQWVRRLDVKGEELLYFEAGYVIVNGTEIWICDPFATTVLHKINRVEKIIRNQQHLIYRRQGLWYYYTAKGFFPLPAVPAAVRDLDMAGDCDNMYASHILLEDGRLWFRGSERKLNHETVASEVRAIYPFSRGTIYYLTTDGHLHYLQNSTRTRHDIIQTHDQVVTTDVSYCSFRGYQSVCVYRDGKMCVQATWGEKMTKFDIIDEVQAIDLKGKCLWYITKTGELMKLPRNGKPIATGYRAPHSVSQLYVFDSHLYFIVGPR